MRNSLILAMLVVLVGGCASSKKSESMSDRQDKAMRDPFRYSPEMSRQDISGGGLTEFDNDAFKRDVNSVLNP